MNCLSIPETPGYLTKIYLSIENVETTTETKIE